MKSIIQGDSEDKCYICGRLVRNEYMSCDNKITRPPQSWMHVEDLGEEE
jgi:hypothetical protein